ncbi:MAG: TIM44-like domain-containing protein [Bacteroidetes bacterium]|nr:TIM44-like domain-containing protein [Bacteroidota bacterium]
MKKLFKHLKKNKTTILFNLLTIAFIFTSVALFARAGGGGGSHSGGGSGGGDGIVGLIFWVIMAIPFPWNLIILAVIIVLFFLARKKAKQQTILNQLPTGTEPTKVKGYDQFLANNPDFNLEAFKTKVSTAFIQIQDAWTSQNLSKTRKWISDGVYQRFNTQFKMMALLKQKNTIENLKLHNVYIDKIETDGTFDIVHVAVHASIVDKFISELYPKLNSGGSEEFVEYWSFIKKRGVETKDLFNTANCPKCGGDLPKDAGDASKCEYCGTFTNQGDYDWILSEITQADDYISSNPKLMMAGNLTQKTREMFKDADDFSIQQIEDKVSNGYLQIETAKVLHDTNILRRFVSDSAFDKISKMIPKENMVYNRLYLNDVTVIGAMQKDKKNILMVSVKTSFQRVYLENQKIANMDQTVMTKNEIVVVSRDIDAGLAKGSLYAHSCPSCGGPVVDTVDLTCQYCGAELNSTKNEWIITDLMGYDEYMSFMGANSSDYVMSVNPNKVDSLFEVRDYAFNNVLVMIAADGVFAAEERTFAEELAKRYGYDLKRVQQMFDMAQNGSLVIRMPENQKQRRKIFTMMEKAARADGTISAEEQQLLDSIKEQYPMAA